MNANGPWLWCSTQAGYDASELQTRYAEVDQQAEMQSRGAQVINALGFVNAVERYCGFQFNQDRILDQEISKKSTDRIPL